MRLSLRPYLCILLKLMRISCTALPTYPRTLHMHGLSRRNMGMEGYFACGFACSTSLWLSHFPTKASLLRRSCIGCACNARTLTAQLLRRRRDMLLFLYSWLIPCSSEIHICAYNCSYIYESSSRTLNLDDFSGRYAKPLCCIRSSYIYKNAALLDGFYSYSSSSDGTLRISSNRQYFRLCILSFATAFVVPSSLT